MHNLKTILVTAYAVNPRKGSEDFTGWSWIMQIAKTNKVIAITRENNQEDIEKFQKDHLQDSDIYKNVVFVYYDALPKSLLFWKKGPLLSMIYYYIWQLFLAIWILRKKYPVDIVHNLNFHNDWTASFLWLTNKPFVWGPIGHHNKIPKAFLLPIYGTTAYLKDRFLWILKLMFWNLDPFLRMTKNKASKIIMINSEVKNRVQHIEKKSIIIPAIASENRIPKAKKIGDEFIVLSVGRFVPLKGFDLTILSFAKFYYSLPFDKRINTKLYLIGKGPEKPFLISLIKKANLEDVIKIIEWLPREEVMQFYQKAAVFLFPSHEGAGMVVPEAMSYGLPVLCLNNDGPGELIHPDSLLKVDFDSYESTITNLTDQLIQLFKNNIFYHSESMLACNQFTNYLRWDCKAAKINKLYYEIA